MLPRAMTIARLVLALGRQERATYHEDGIRKETDTDHTVMLALLVADTVTTVPTLRERIDLGEALTYALVHDLVEAYAGDTVSIRLTSEERAAKKAREAAALERLRDEFGADAWLVRKIESYERQDTLEARFVHFMDKIAPKLTHALNRGRTMRDLGFGIDAAAGQHVAQLAELAGGSPDLPEMAELFHEAHEAAIRGIAMGLATERVAGRWMIPGSVPYVEVQATIPDDDGELLERLRKTIITAPDDAWRNHLRIGQRAFNALNAVAPRLADRIRATPADPFHDDERIEAFVIAVAAAHEADRDEVTRMRVRVVDALHDAVEARQDATLAHQRVTFGPLHLNDAGKVILLEAEIARLQAEVERLTAARADG